MSHSPSKTEPSRDYAEAWAAITRLIHEDGSWSSREHNIGYLNIRDGTFADVSGTLGIDFAGDSRSFAVLDLDFDGDADLILKSRTEPGLRVLRNDLGNTGRSVSFRLRGVKSNRDAVGARLVVFSAGRPITKTLRAGSGFLSQHSKELLFGLGANESIEKVRVEWPSGAVQEFATVPAHHRITIREDSADFAAEPYRGVPGAPDPAPSPEQQNPAAEAAGSWLLEPVPAPDFELTDLRGRSHRLADYRGKRVLLNFWATWCPPCRGELRHFEQQRERLRTLRVELLTIAVNEPGDQAAVHQFAERENLTFPVLDASEKVVGEYNILKKHMFNRRSDMQIPTTLLLNPDGAIEKIYEGPVTIDRLIEDLHSPAPTAHQRLARALPFAGRFYGGTPRRDHSRLGLALYRKGYLDAALVFLEHGARATPADPAAHYNLATAYIEQHALDRAQESFERSLDLNPEYAEAHNGLGALLARQGRLAEAETHFQAALRLRPQYAKALTNLATVYEQQKKTGEAVRLLEVALAADAGDPAVLGKLGVLYGRRGDLPRARATLERALARGTDDPETASNLALVYAEMGEVSEAVRRLSALLGTHPAFEKTYLVLATLYAKTGERQKAADVLKRLLERNPSHRQARAMLDQLGL